MTASTIDREVEKGREALSNGNGQGDANVTVETGDNKALTFFHAFDTPLAAMREGGVDMSGIGIRFAKGIKAEDAPKIGSMLIRMEQLTNVALNFALGDWYNWVQKTFPRKASQIISDIPEYKYETLKNYAWVSNAIPIDLRTPKINWTVYTKMAPADVKFIVDTLKAFNEGTLDYAGVVDAVEKDQKRRAQAELKRRQEQQRRDAATAAGDTEPGDSTDSGAGEGSGDSASQTASQGAGQEPAAPSVPKVGIVVEVDTTFAMMDAARTYLQRKVWKSKTKPSDNDVLAYILAKFCSMNRLTVKGVTLEDIGDNADNTDNAEPQQEQADTNVTAPVTETDPETTDPAPEQPTEATEGSQGVEASPEVQEILDTPSEL